MLYWVSCCWHWAIFLIASTFFRLPQSLFSNLWVAILQCTFVKPGCLSVSLKNTFMTQLILTGAWQDLKKTFIDLWAFRLHIFPSWTSDPFYHINGAMLWTTFNMHSALNISPKIVINHLSQNSTFEKKSNMLGPYNILY